MFFGTARRLACRAALTMTIATSFALAQGSSSGLVTSTTNLYTLTDLILLFPVEGTTIFVAVVLLASLVEGAIQRLSDQDDEYVQLIYVSAREEAIVASVLLMLFIFVKSTGSLSGKWILMMDYGVMSLVFIVIIFLIMTVIFSVVMNRSMGKWQQFEASRIDADPMLSSTEVVFRQCRDRFRESIVAVDGALDNAAQENHGTTPGIVTKIGSDGRAMLQHQSTGATNATNTAQRLRRSGFDPSTMPLSPYLRQCVKYTVAEIIDLQWKSWLALAVMVVINGTRSRITTGSAATIDNTTRLVQAVSYIAIVGYGALFMYVVIHFILARRLRKMAQEPIAKLSEHGDKIVVDKPSENLFFGRFTTTCHVVQVPLLLLEWYLAYFILGQAASCFRSFGLFGILFLLGAISPLAVFLWMLPWTATMITLMSTLGQDLNQTELAAAIRYLQGREDDADAALQHEQDHSRNNADGATTAVGGGGATTTAPTTTSRPDQDGDEWSAVVTLHEHSQNKALDREVVPASDIPHVAHPNATPRRAGFKRAALRPVFLPSFSLPPLTTESDGGARWSSSTTTATARTTKMMERSPTGGDSSPRVPRAARYDDMDPTL